MHAVEGDADKANGARAEATTVPRTVTIEFELSADETLGIVHPRLVSFGAESAIASDVLMVEGAAEVLDHQDHEALAGAHEHVQNRLATRTAFKHGYRENNSGSSTT